MEANTPKKVANKGKIIFLMLSLMMIIAIVAAVVFVPAFGVRDRIFGAEPEYVVPVFGPTTSEMLAAQTLQHDVTLIAMMEEVVKRDTIYSNIYVNGINVSGLTKAEAMDRVTAELAYINDLEIDVSWAGGRRNDTYVLKFSEFGIEYDIFAAVDRAFAFGRTGSLFERFTVVMGLNDRGYHVEAAFSYDEDMVINVLSRFMQYNQNPIDATINFDGGRFNITQSQPGIAVDIAGMEADIKELLRARTSGVIEISTTVVEPRYTEADLQQATTRIGTMTTNFDPHGRWGRNENIRIASSRINGITVMPGEVFSTNDSFGPVNAAHGWQMAAGFNQGRVVDSIGGGMCQVSSTLYVALLYAELEIVERRNHSIPVDYLPMAFDATLVTGMTDLRFRNNTDYPVTIIATTTAGSVTVSIYGRETRPANRSIRLDSFRQWGSPIQPPAPNIIEDPSLAYGVRITDVPARQGFDYRLYKFVYINGVQTEQIRINHSHYRVSQAQIRVGTAGRPGTQPEQPYQPHQPYQPYAPEQQEPAYEPTGYYNPTPQEPIYEPIAQEPPVVSEPENYEVSDDYNE